MDSPSPILPLGQLILMFFSWISFFVYIHMVTGILTFKRGDSSISSPFYMILVACSIGDFAMFFHIELVMRTRKFRFFSFFNSSTPQWFAYYSYFLSAYFRTIMQLSYIPMAVNRFTAFATPLYYKRIWKTKYIFIYTASIWIVSLALTLNLFLWEDIQMKWSILPTGVMQTLANRYFYLDAILSTSVCIFSCIVCIVFYAIGAYYSTKNVQLQQSFEIEKKLYGCSLLASIPLLIEGAKSLILLWATMVNNREMLVFLTEFWFYWTEFMTSSQCWSVLLVTPHVRRLLVETGVFGLLGRNNQIIPIITDQLTSSNGAARVE